MRLLPALLAAAALAAASAHAQSAPAGTSRSRPPEPVRPIDWAALDSESVRLLSEYLRTNTTNPPGNEMRAIRFLTDVLEREGFAVQVLDTAELGAGRGNLYARLKGSGKKKAIALVHHLDVVPATPSFWSVDPFAGTIKDGYVYGRGALDMKGQGIVHLMAMLALKRGGVPLDRDIVFIANSDEEIDGAGAAIFAEKHADLLRDVEFLITEGGDNPVKDGKVEYVGVGVSEKRGFWQTLTVRGVASHGSRPTPQNPVPKLVGALYRISRWETPLHVTPGVAKYFRDIAVLHPQPQRGWLRDVAAAVRQPRARAWITGNVYWNAILRNTISETMLEGSPKTNIIPSEATARLDIRLLPDADARAFRAELQRVIADTAVHLGDFEEPRPPLESPVGTDFFRAVERAARDRIPNVIVTSPMLTGGTDRPMYRALGIITYGLDPFLVETADAQHGVHGNDERVSVENVEWGVRFVYDILRYAQ